MKAYVLERFFDDYEVSSTEGVLSDETKAKEWTLREVLALQSKSEYYGKMELQPLPTGYKVGGQGFIYREFEIDALLIPRKEESEVKSHGT